MYLHVLRYENLGIQKGFNLKGRCGTCSILPDATSPDHTLRLR